MRPTAADPSEPVLPASAIIESVDRMKAPYNPDNPVYIEENIAWADFAARLAADGL